MEAVGKEMEEDVFFAELSRQISRLIMDDDEDDLPFTPSLNLRRVVDGEMMCPNEMNHARQMSGSREIRSKGTGVFIPRSGNNSRRMVNNGAVKRDVGWSKYGSGERKEHMMNYYYCYTRSSADHHYINNPPSLHKSYHHSSTRF